MNGSDLLQMRYFDTYWYAQLVQGVICDPLDYEFTYEEFIAGVGIPRLFQRYPKWSWSGTL